MLANVIICRKNSFLIEKSRSKTKNLPLTIVSRTNDGVIIKCPKLI